MAADTENIFKILVATDNHVGYLEKDQVRGGDSLEAFEEVLKIAQEQQVDFILLGGDLFHDNKPSRQVLTRTMELLRHYCMGDRPCPIEFRSDQSIDFHHSKFPVVNYEDPNYNVSIPVFSIHGNHDDPAGAGNLSAVDILSVANLVNYFGKTANVEAIQVSPLLLQKGSSRLALYGLGSCRDERLHRMMRRKQVTFLRPEGEGEGAEEDWFSLLVLHQNRAKHGQTNHIPENFLPGFLDLVIWGHEHECRIDAEYSVVGTDAEGEEQGIYISQPGSSVATSLSEGETRKKHVGLLYIKGTGFKMEPIPLQCVRPFVMDSVILSQTGIHHREEQQIITHLTEKVRELVDRANAENQQNKLPLVRLKVEYSGDYETFSMARFGQRFVTEVANPRSILQWYRQRKSTSLKKRDGTPEPAVQQTDGGAEGEGEGLSMPVLVEQQLQNQKLSLLSEKNLTEALTQFVDKEDTDAISDFVKYSLEKAQSYLKERPGINEADIDTQIARQREELLRRQEEGASSAHMEMSQSRSLSSSRAGGEGDGVNREGEEGEDGERGEGTSGAVGRGRRGSTSRGGGSGRGRGRGRGRGGRGGKGASGAKGKSTAASKESATAVHTPALEFSARSTRGTKPARNSKRITYDESDPSSEEEVCFIPPAKKKKRAPENVIDLSQDSDDEGGSGGNVSMFSAPSTAVRRKR